MILVTGGAGFIGSHLVEQLARNHEVVVLDNLSAGDQNLKLLKQLKVRFIQSDVQDFYEVQNAVQDCDIVFHLAAMNRAARSIRQPLEANAINVTGTLNVLEACRKKDSALVFASSSSVYGGGGEVKKEEGPRVPLHPYGVGKLAAEEYCRVYGQIYGLRQTCLRYASVFGPRQRPDIEYAAVIPKFINAVMRGKAVTVFGDGKQTRQFTYVNDTVDATIVAAQNPKSWGHVFNIASSESASILQLVHLIEAILAKKVDMEFLPRPPSDPLHNPLDVSKIKKVLHWQAAHTFEQGLRKTIQSFQ